MEVLTLLVVHMVAYTNCIIEHGVPRSLHYRSRKRQYS